MKIKKNTSHYLERYGRVLLRAAMGHNVMLPYSMSLRTPILPWQLEVKKKKKKQTNSNECLLQVSLRTKALSPYTSLATPPHSDAVPDPRLSSPPLSSAAAITSASRVFLRAAGAIVLTYRTEPNWTLTIHHQSLTIYFNFHYKTLSHFTAISHITKNTLMSICTSIFLAS